MAATIWGSHGKSNDDDGKYRLCSSKSPKDKKKRRNRSKTSMESPRDRLGRVFFFKKKLCSIIPNHPERK